MGKKSLSMKTVFFVFILGLFFNVNAYAAQLINVEYNTGGNGYIINDDYVTLTFSDPITNIGSESDYLLTFTGKKPVGGLDETFEITVLSEEISITTTAATVVKASFTGSSSNLYTNLHDAYDMQVRVEIPESNNIEPAINTVSAMTIAIPGRNSECKTADIELGGNRIPASLIDTDAYYAEGQVFHNIIFDLLPADHALINSSTKIFMTAKDSNATVPAYVERGSGSYTFGRVTSEDTFFSRNYEMLYKNNRALLTNVIVKEADDTNFNIGFSPYIKEYTITLPAGTYRPPTVVGQLDAASPFSINTETSGSLSSESTYTITLNIANSDQFISDQSYKFNFTVAASGPPTQLVSAIYNKGTTAAINNEDFVTLNFANALTMIGTSADYQVLLDKDKDGIGETTIPSEQYTVSQPSPTTVRLDFKTIDESIMSNIKNAQLIIAVVNPSYLEPDIDASNTVMASLPGRNAKAKGFELTFDGSTYAIDGFDPDGHQVFVPVPSLERTDILNGATLQGTTLDEDASMVVPSALLSSDPILVTAEDGFVTKEYSVVARQSFELLNSIFVNGSSLNEFNPYKLSYDIVLPAGTRTFPTVTQAFYNGLVQNDVTIEQVITGDLSTTYTITINLKSTSDNRTINTYVVNFTVAASGPPTQLVSAIYNKGTTAAINNEDFVTLNFANALTMIGTSADYQVLLDKDKDGIGETTIPSEQYTVSQPSPTTVRLDFKTIDESIMSNIKEAQLIIAVVNPSYLEPDIDVSNTVMASLPGRNAKAKGFELTFDGSTYAIDGFDPDGHQVFVPVPSLERTDILNGATLQGTTLDEDASMVVPSALLSSDPILVTAEDGFVTKEYSVAARQSFELLNSIFVNGSSLNEFNPYKMSYSITLAPGTISKPIVKPAFYGNITPENVIVEQIELGEFPDEYIVALKIKSATDNRLLNTYVVNVTVEPMKEEKKSSSEGSSSSDSSSSSSSSSKSTRDTQIIETYEKSASDLSEKSADKIINLLENIKTPEGARRVLKQMPTTLNDLIAIKSTLSSLDDQLKLDEDIIKLLNESERLIALLRTTQNSEKVVTDIIKTMGDTYKQMDKSSSNTIDMRNNLIDLSNQSISKAGEISTNWNHVDVKDGRVYLEISKSEISAAVRKVAEQEKVMEKTLSDALQSGLENGIISTLTVGLPENIKLASKIGFDLDKDTIKILKDNNIEQLKLSLGPVSFNVNDKFLEQHENTSFEFNVTRGSALKESDNNKIPKGTAVVGAPVVDVSAKQNSVLDDSFNHPLQLVIHLDYFDYKPNVNEIDQLVVGRLNEKTNEWEPVGGKYDPSTNTIVVYRSHLSKYTVLKNEKNFSTLEDSWAKNEISTLKGKGIIEREELFNANENITREEFANWILTAYGLDEETLEDELKAIDQNSVYFDALEAAYKEGTVRGNSSNQYLSNEALTKEEMAVMIASAMDKYDYPINPETTELAYYEEDLPTWAVSSVETVVENGIANEAFFGSRQKLLTKEEAASILYQVYR